jgi:hypothetical protein
MEKFIKDILDRLGKITIELETIFNDNVSSQKQKLADITKKYTFKAWNVIYKEYTLQQTTTNHTDIDKKYADDQKHFDRENFLVEYVLTDKDDFINNDISTVEISGLYDSYLEYDRHDHYDANKIADKNKLIETLYLTYNELKIYLGGPLTVMSSTTNTMSKVDIKVVKIYTTQDGIQFLYLYADLLNRFIYSSVYTVKLLSLSPNRLLFYLTYLRDKNRIDELHWACTFLSIIFMRTDIYVAFNSYSEIATRNQDTSFIRYIIHGLHDATKTKKLHTPADNFDSMTFCYFRNLFEDKTFQTMKTSGSADGLEFLARVLNYVKYDMDKIFHLFYIKSNVSTKPIVGPSITTLISYGPDKFNKFSLSYLNYLVRDQHKQFNVSFVLLNNKGMSGNSYSNRFKKISTSNNRFVTLNYDINVTNQTAHINEKTLVAEDVKTFTFGGFTRVLLPSFTIKESAKIILSEITNISNNCFILGYGCSGAGKTYSLVGTIENNEISIPTIEKRGLISNICALIVKQMMKLPDDIDKIDDIDEAMSITYSSREIYMNDEIKITDNEKITSISKLHEMIHFIFKSDRKLGNNGMNDESSRSHCIAILQFSYQDTTKNIIFGDYAGVEPDELFQFEGDDPESPKMKVNDDIKKFIIDANNIKNSDKKNKELEKIHKIFTDFNKDYLDIFYGHVDKMKSYNTSFVAKDTLDYLNRIKDDYLIRYMLFDDITRVPPVFTLDNPKIVQANLIKRKIFFYKNLERFNNYNITSPEAKSINETLEYLKRDLKYISETRIAKLFGKIYSSDIATECFDDYFHTIKSTQPRQIKLANKIGSSRTFDFIRNTLKITDISILLPCLLCVVDISTELDRKIKNPYYMNDTKNVNQKSMIGSLEFADKFSKLFTIPNICRQRINDETNLDEGGKEEGKESGRKPNNTKSNSTGPPVNQNYFRV